uniref:Coiled-coil domain-containing protein 63 n=1 Tax=Schistosoma mansoni TaxID=6183 RepID=A0A3Q0KBC8_SCHMA
MPRPTSAQSEQEDNTDLLLIEEYERLHNQLRILQNERQKQTEEFTVKLGKYKKATEILEKENEEIKCLLTLVDSAQNRKQDMKCIEQLKQILQEQDNIQLQIDELKTYGKRLDNEIRKIENLIQEKQQIRLIQTKKETETAELKIQIEKKLLIMENNLHEKNMKFCDTLAYNNKIRHEIECARNERNIYYSIHQKLKEKLIHLNKLKTKLIQQANITYDQRADAKNKSNALKEKNDKDSAGFETEIKDLQRIIDHNDQLRKFMVTKSDERLEWKQKAENRRRKYGATGEIAQQQRSLKIQEYESAMNRLQLITGKSDVEQMTRYYKRNEDDNFTMFKYVTELNNQIECLNDNIINIEKTINEYDEEQKVFEKQRVNRMNELQAQIKSDKEAANTAENRTTHIHKLLDQIKTEIKQLTIKLGCDLSRITEMLGGDGDQITERNLMLYLNVLEQRVDELLTVKCYSQNKGHSDEMNQDNLKITLAPNFMETMRTNRDTSLVLPSLQDEDDTNDDENTPTSIRPLSQAEIIGRVTRQLQKLETKHHPSMNTNKTYSRVSSPNRRLKIRM